MKISALGTVLFTDTPADDARFYVEHFGFEVAAQLGFYTSLRHPGLERFSLDLLREDGRPLGHGTSADVLLAFVVEDVLREKARLEKAGLRVLMQVRDEPWGQRRFRVEAPGAIVELVQAIAPDVGWLEQMGLA